VSDPAGRLRAFAYVNADKVALYRAIMRVFVDSKASFTLHLRPHDVVAAVARAGLPEPADAVAVEAALGSLREWGNLEAHPDTADVATVEEFYRPRYLFQLTAEGEAAERALAVYETTLRQRGELQTAALGDIRALLGELAELAGAPPVDEAKAHRTLTALRERFEGLTSRAQTFMQSLQRTIDLQGAGVPHFLAYKETLIGYLERFIGELVVATGEIGATIERVEERGVHALLDAAARRDLADAIEVTAEEEAAAAALWHARWAGLRSWFIGRAESPSQAEVLRARARASIPALLGAVISINDRRFTRSDRAADLRTLARWFAEADSDAAAHRLWRAAFALAPARHLLVDAETLEQREARPVPARTSWLDAPPLSISPRLRSSGRYTRRGRPNDVIDRSRDKRLLAEAAAAEAAQIAAARRRLAGGRPMRLSDLGELDAAEFGLFLDVLGDTLSVRLHADERAEVVSLDGSLHVTLEPIGDGRIATIVTTTGRFSGADHYITIRDLVGGTPPPGENDDRGAGGEGNGGDGHRAADDRVEDAGHESETIER
jgi:uncharacterized protein (TIGR02677 family)